MFKGKNVLITGTNRGIGKAMLEAFARKGANIWAHSRIETEKFKTLISNLSKKYGVKICPLYFDMTDTDAMKEAVKEIKNSKLPVNIIVNNAGIAHGGLFQMTPIAKIKEVFEVNLFSHMELTQLLLRFMPKQEDSAIINISSISGINLKSGNSAYGVSKAAMIAWTKVLAKENSQFGIRVNAIAPGITDTDMGALNSESYIDSAKSTGLKRIAKPEEIADVALYLASSDASYITGQVICVDGGINSQ